MGIAPAIANGVFHAIGKRVQPIPRDKLAEPSKPKQTGLISLAPEGSPPARDISLDDRLVKFALNYLMNEYRRVLIQQ